MTEPIARATRFPLHLALRFRPIGSPHWHAGTTENISRTGVLFRTGSPPAVGGAIEMQIALTGSARQTANCEGHVVRTSGLSDDGQALIAATIIDHRLVAGDPVVDTLSRGSHEAPD